MNKIKKSPIVHISGRKKVGEGRDNMYNLRGNTKKDFKNPQKQMVKNL